MIVQGLSVVDKLDILGMGKDKTIAFRAYQCHVSQCCRCTRSSSHLEISEHIDICVCIPLEISQDIEVRVCVASKIP